MKKIFAAYLFLLPSLLFAQDFHAGIRAGLCGTQVDGDTYEGFDKAGVTCGIFVTRKLSDIIALRMEINYIQKGSRKPTDDMNTFYVMRLGYIEVPVLIQWNVSPVISFFGGPSYGVLISSQEENEFGIIYGMPPFKKNEIAGRLGGSYKLSDNWSVDARYSISLVTIRPSAAGYIPYYFQSGQFNRLIELGLSYQF